MPPSESLAWDREVVTAPEVALISPFASRHWLASELTMLLSEARCTAKDLAGRAGVDPRRISYLLKAERKPSSGDVTRMLNHLPVPKARRRLLLDVAEAAEQQGWWERYSNEMGQRQARYADLEAGAEIAEYAQTLFPGLLQSQTYATVRAIADKACHSKRFLVDRAVAARARRQEFLLGPRSRGYEVVLDEVMFHRAAAPPAVIENQIKYMVAVAVQTPAVTMRILRLNTLLPGNTIPATSFSIYRYHDLNEFQIVAIETDDTDLLTITDPTKVATYRARYELLCRTAKDPAETLEFLVAEADNLSRTERRSA